LHDDGLRGRRQCVVEFQRKTMDRIFPFGACWCEAWEEEFAIMQESGFFE
jgi:hypothetical protein